MVMLGLVAVLAAGGIAGGRAAAAAEDASTTTATLATQPFPFNLVAMARAAQDAAHPVGSLRFELEPEDWEPPLLRKGSRNDPVAIADDTAVIEPDGGAAIIPGPLPIPPSPAEPGPPAATAFIWPVAGASITQYYSAFHPGLDLAAPYGTAVVAAAPGVVTYSGWRFDGGGMVVAIDHGNGITTVYNHNSSVWVSVGQQVAAGEGIAGVGCTGLCTGPHVHFAVIVGNVAMNPLRYL